MLYFENICKKSGTYKSIQTNGLAFFELSSFKCRKRINLKLTDNLLMFVLSGKKKIVIGENLVIVKPGSFVFLQKGNYIDSTIVPDDETMFRSILCIINNSYILELMKKYPNYFEGITQENNILNYCTFNTSPHLQAIIESLIPYFDYKHDESNALFNLKFEELIINILNNDRERIFARLLHDNITYKNIDLTVYMEQHYLQDITIAQHAKNTFQSLSSFKKEFMKTFGLPPKKWIINKKLEYAHSLLHSTQYPVTEICFLSGFNSLSNFIRLFKEKYNSTPKQLQKTN